MPNYFSNLTYSYVKFYKKFSDKILTIEKNFLLIHNKITVLITNNTVNANLNKILLKLLYDIFTEALRKAEGNENFVGHLVSRYFIITAYIIRHADDMYNAALAYRKEYINYAQIANKNIKDSLTTLVHVGIIL